MKLDVILMIGLFIVGVLLGVNVTGWCFKEIHRSVGIKDIKYCEIKTPSCESNWWEIVWADQAKQPVK